VGGKLSIMVLMGGSSVEREVSLRSGLAVAEALESLGHEVLRRDVRPDDLSALGRAEVDVVFVALHGTFGEDGQLQGVLEGRGIRYCGSAPAASHLAMDKVEAKRRFVEVGVPTPAYDVADDGRVAEVVENWSVPVVVKPVDQGSSVDCYVVREARELQPRVSELVGRYGRCLVEQYIDGPELTVGVVGDEALPVCEIRSGREFYDYEAKYEDDSTEYIFDIDLPPELLERVQRQSLAVHRAVGCRDMSRVDWMVDGATLDAYCLELNTIPGFTDHSLLPKAAGRAGMSFERLCQRIVELAMQR